ncbi:MAG: SCO family protein [bacterium]
MTLREVYVTENIGRQLPLDVEVKDINEDIIPISRFFNQGKPIVLFFGYYTCPMLCHFVAQGVSAAINDASLKLGLDYRVLMLSINPDERLSAAIGFRDQYVSKLSSDVKDEETDWHFLRADLPAIDRLSDALGFSFRYNANSKEFAHSAVIFILSPKGKISRYLYGISFQKLDFKLAILEASDEKYISSMDRLLLFCYNYDPQSRVYVIMAKRIMQVGGVLIIFIIILMMFLFNKGRLNK